MDLVAHAIAEGAVDREFVSANAVGLDALAEAVTRFTPARVAERAGISEQDLRAAARIIATAKRGNFGTGTGVSMSCHGTLTTCRYDCLQTLRGFWALYAT